MIFEVKTCLGRPCLVVATIMYSVVECLWVGDIMSGNAKRNVWCDLIELTQWRHLVYKNVKFTILSAVLLTAYRYIAVLLTAYRFYFTRNQLAVSVLPLFTSIHLMMVPK